MTKKHFEHAAKLVRSMRKNHKAHANLVENKFIKLFQDFNPRFNEKLFRKACR